MSIYKIVQVLDLGLVIASCGIRIQYLPCKKGISLRPIHTLTSAFVSQLKFNIVPIATQMLTQNGFRPIDAMLNFDGDIDAKLKWLIQRLKQLTYLYFSFCVLTRMFFKTIFFVYSFPGSHPCQVSLLTTSTP